MIHRVNVNASNKKVNNIRQSSFIWSLPEPLRFWLLSILVALLAGCSTMPVEPEPVRTPEPIASKPTQPITQPDPDDYPVAPFPGDSLYELLVAEVAGYRSRYDIALDKYMAAVIETRDPGVAARATRLALYLKKYPEALETALIWAEVDPENVSARRHAMDLLLRADELEAAIGHMEAVKQLGGKASFDVFAYRAAGLAPKQREAVLAAITEMLERYPEDEQLLFSKAVLLEQSGRLPEALVIAEELLTVAEKLNVIVLKVRVLDAMHREDDAIAYLTGVVGVPQPDRRLQLILARMLFEKGDLEAAKVQYNNVLNVSPNDGDVLFALALIALEQEDDLQAQAHLERMVRWNRRSGEAHYYLGGIAERRSDTMAALEEYAQAGDGYEFIPAQARIASLLANDGLWEEARAHLDNLRAQKPAHRQQLILIEAQLLADRGQEQETLDFLEPILQQEPENIELLYYRAMTGQRFGRLDILEADLRRVIELDPENADALNALGYTLTDQTNRHEEALVLIEKALAIKPDEAAYIDSLGWVQYRLSNFEKALTYLRQAYEMFQNDEIAAHLGEVLWVAGDKNKANQVWQEALKLTPESEILKNVIQRFRIE
jgi:tetratricopeptide (TPR) repeat protein